MNFAQERGGFQKKKTLSREKRRKERKGKSEKKRERERKWKESFDSEVSNPPPPPFMFRTLHIAVIDTKEFH